MHFLRKHPGFLRKHPGCLRKHKQILLERSNKSENKRETQFSEMKLPIVENVPTPWESIFKLCTASQLPYNEKK